VGDIAAGIEQVRDLARRFIAGLADGDFDGVADLFADDGVHHDDGYQRLARGKDEIRRGLSARYGDWPGAVEIVGPFVTTDGYCYLWTVEGRSPQGTQWLRARSTGSPWRVRGTAAGTVQDGRIVEHLTSWNLVDLLVPLGIDAVPPATDIAALCYTSIRKKRPAVHPEVPAIAATRLVLDRYWQLLRLSSVTNDFSGLAGLFAPDMYEEEIGLRHETRTLEDQIALWNDIRRSWPHSVEVEWMLVGDGGYVVCCLCAGRMQHDFAGLPGNGRSYAIRYMSVGVVRDGLVSRVRDPSNGIGLLQDIALSRIPSSWKTGQALSSTTPVDAE
jgi:hypothetical protein